MPKILPVEVGAVYGLLTITGEVPTPPGKPKKLLVRCQCGVSFEAVKGSVLHGNTTSCGCKRKATLVSMLTTHGLCSRTNKHPLYSVWFDMRRRCNDTKNKAYPRYGGRGIKVESCWDKFENFLRDMGEKPYPEATIERLDTNGNYGPDNCVWASRQDQIENRRVSLRYEYKGQEYSISELRKLATLFGVSKTALHSRLSKGIPVEVAVESPLKPPGRRKVADDGRSKTLRPGVKLLYGV